MAEVCFGAIATLVGGIAIDGTAAAWDEISDEWAPYKDPNNPEVIVLKPDDQDVLVTRRDTSHDPKRDPGRVTPQRYASGIITRSTE